MERWWIALTTKRPKIYSFTRLIAKYTIDFKLQLFNDDTSKDKAHYDDLGKPVVPVTHPIIPARGALIPPTSQEIYQAGGRLTSSDRILYISENDYPEGLPILPPKTKIFDRGNTYYVEGDGYFLDFGDFMRYTLRRVSAFDD